MKERLDDGDLRMLGARDGLVHGLILVREIIGRITYRAIPARQTRRLAERERLLKPLREIESRLVKLHIDTVAAYERSRKPLP